MNNIDIFDFYYEHNFRLIKILKNEKYPIEKWRGIDNYHKYTKEQYISEYSRYTGNIAINCGLSNLIVIDCDKKHGKDGEKALRNKLTDQQFKEICNTYTVFTPTGGLHFYFKTDRLVPTTHSKWLDGIDIQCNGGYVVAPPSVTKVGKYINVPNKDIQDIPEFLFKEISNIVVEYNTPTATNVKKHLIHLTNAKPGNRDDRLNTFSYIFARYIRDSVSSCDEKLFLLETFTSLVKDIPMFQEWDDYKKIENIFYKAYNETEKLAIESIADADIAANIQLSLNHKVYKIIEFPKKKQYVYYSNGIWINDYHAYNLITQEYNKCITILSNKIAHKYNDLLSIDDEEKKKLEKEISLLESRLEQLKRYKKMKDVFSMLDTSANFIKSIEEFDTNTDILTFKNGVYNFKTKQLEAHNPDNYSTKNINLNYTNIINNNCKFMQFIKQIMPNSKEREFILLCLGYAFTSVNHWKKFFIFQGETETGKSTLMNILLNILNYGNSNNSYTNSINIDTFNRYNTNSSKDYYLADLKGKIVSFLMELPRGYNLNENFIKSITGDDLISGRSIRKDPTSFKVSTKLFIVSNHDINISDIDNSIWNRVILFKFKHRIKNINRKWIQQFTEEDYTESLAILLRYAQRAYNVDTVEPYIPESIQNDIVEYRNSQDWVKEILDTYFETDNVDVIYKISSTTMLNCFNIARNELGLKGNIGHRTLKEILKKKEVLYLHNRTGRYYCGIRVIDVNFFIRKGIHYKDIVT